MVPVILHAPQGGPVNLPAGPPFAVDFLVLTMIFHFQVTLQDIVVVHPSPTPPLEVTDDPRKQGYRMYHIYDRNLLVCIVPFMSITASFSGFILSSCLQFAFLRRSIREPVAAGCVLLHSIISDDLKALAVWSAASFWLTIL